MAYRTFSQPTPYRPAKFDGMPNVLRAIQTNKILKAKKEKEARAAQVELEKRIGDVKLRKFEDTLPADADAIFEMAKNLKESKINDLSTVSRVTGETMKMEDDVERFAFESKTLKNELDQIENLAKEFNDPFINKDHIFADIMAERVKGFVGGGSSDVVNVSDKKYYMKDFQMADWIKRESANTITTIIETANGETKTILKGAFIDANGDVTVSREDANRWLKSHPLNKDIYNEAVLSDIMDDIEEMKKPSNLKFLKPELIKKLRSLSNKDLITYFSDNPEDNPFDKRTFAERGLDMAAADIKRGVKTNLNVDFDLTAKKGDPSPDEELSKAELAKNRLADLRYKTTQEIVVDKKQASLNTVVGAFTGIKEASFVSTDYVGDGPHLPNDNGKNFIRIVYDKKLYGGKTEEERIVFIPIMTKQEQKEAGALINTYLDNQFKGTASDIGGDRFREFQRKDEYYKDAEDKKNPFEVDLKKDK